MVCKLTCCEEVTWNQMTMILAWQQWTDTFEIVCCKNTAEKELVQYCLLLVFTMFYPEQRFWSERQLCLILSFNQCYKVFKTPSVIEIKIFFVCGAFYPSLSSFWQTKGRVPLIVVIIKEAITRQKQVSCSWIVCSCPSTMASARFSLLSLTPKVFSMDFFVC